MTTGQPLSLPEKILLEMAYEGDYELRQALIWLRSELPGFDSRNPDWTELRHIAEATIRSLIHRALVYLEYRRCKDGNCEWLEISADAVDEALEIDEAWHLGDSQNDHIGGYDEVALFATSNGVALYESGAAAR